MNRRELLKYFAAGTVIAPLAASKPVARLLEVPKVELVKAPEIVAPESINLRHVTSVTLTLHMDSGISHSMDGHVYVWHVYVYGESPIIDNCEMTRIVVQLQRPNATSPESYGRIADFEMIGFLK
jgi:hypothetical protein